MFFRFNWGDLALRSVVYRFSSYKLLESVSL